MQIAVITVKQMKKTILIIAAASISFTGIAQDKYVVSANVALNNKNLDEAKESIDKAMASPETKEKPKALFTKVQIYYQMQNDPKYKASSPYREAYAAAIKLIEVKPDYEKTTIDQLLVVSAFLYYNDGVKANNDKRYTESAEYMKNVVKIHEMGNGGKRFEKFPADKMKQFDTVSAEAYLTMANATYYSGKNDEAVPLLINAKNNPITRTATVYECLIDSYLKLKNTTEEFNTIEEARKAFPDDMMIRNYELNYYITAGKMDELLKKLEEAAVKEPNNADIQFNLATTYLGMAIPKDGKRPANSAELSAKSEAAFQKAVQIEPDNAGFNYNYGALYYNQATDVNSEMNALGTSAADQKKYDELKAKRDALFVKSSPYFEKSYTVLSAKEGTLKGEDMSTYKSTLLALQEVYLRQNKNDKSVEMKKKYEALNVKK
jgi:hypothetical protein